MWLEQREGDQADNGCCGDEQGIAYLPPEQHDKDT